MTLYQLINMKEAVEYYGTIGYQLIEVPWIVNATVLLKGKSGVFVNHNYFQPGRYHALVGSAEQSFLHLWRCKRTTFDVSNKYMAITPCFRNESTYDDFTKPWFWKLELFRPGPFDCIKEQCVSTMCSNVLSFLTQRWGQTDEIQVKETKEGYDIEICGIEVGSYGYRKFEDFEWIYGTGLAEPRYSMAVDQMLEGRKRKKELNHERNGLVDKLRRETGLELRLCKDALVNHAWNYADALRYLQDKYKSKINYENERMILVQETGINYEICSHALNQSDFIHEKAFLWLGDNGYYGPMKSDAKLKYLKLRMDRDTPNRTNG